VTLRLIALRAHEPVAECALGLVLIVGATAQPQITRDRTTAPREWLDVIELET
jgi:hypothetical protein